MNHRITKIVALGAVAVLVPTLLLAAFAHGERAAGGRSFLGQLSRRLDLTADQRTQIRSILESHKSELTTEITALKDKRTALFEAIHADTFDETAIRNAAASSAKAEADFAVTRGKIVSEVRPILNADQQAKLKQMLARAETFAGGIVDRILDRLDSGAI